MEGLGEIVEGSYSPSTISGSTIPAMRWIDLQLFDVDNFLFRVILAASSLGESIKDIRTLGFVEAVVLKNHVTVGTANNLLANVEHRMRFLKFRFLRICGAVFAVFSAFMCNLLCMYEMLRVLYV